MNKVAVAKEVAKEEPDYSLLYLDREIEKLIERIKGANS